VQNITKPLFLLKNFSIWIINYNNKIRLKTIITRFKTYFWGVLFLKDFKIGIFGIIGILVLVVFASGCVSSDNNTTNSSSSSNGQSNSQSASSSGTAMVKIIGSGAWSGDIGDSSGSKTVSGSGSQSFPLAQDPGFVTASFSKTLTNDANDSNGDSVPDTSTLTVQIIDQNGNVVATQSTSADGGDAATSYQF
jgi:hypothetical protein